MYLANLSDGVWLQVLLTLLILLTLHLGGRQFIMSIVRRVVRSHKYEKKIDEQKRENTLAGMLRTTYAIVLWVIGVIIILYQLNINLAALATGAGLIGVVVGFGAQNTIKDFLGGLFIILENQYRVDDIVTLRADGTDISGMVEEVTIRITRMRDLDGRLHIIPNGSITVVTNWTFEHANVNVDVGVAYGSDIDLVEKVINEVGQSMAADDAWAPYIIEPIQYLRVDGFEDSAVRIKSLGKVEPAKQWDVAGEFRRRLLKAFPEAGISIPFPQVVIHKPKA